MPEGPPRPPVPSGAGVGAPVSGPSVTAMQEEGFEEAVSPAQLTWRRFRRHKVAMGSGILLLLIALASIFAGQLSGRAYTQQELALGKHGPGTCRWIETDPETGADINRQRFCPFGTDDLGRDMLSRVLYGGRISLAVGAGVALSSGIVGTLIGAIAGFYGGRLDNFLMRTTDLFLSIPLLVILIMGSKIFGGTIFDIVLILSLFFWMPVARIVRGVFLSLKEKEFVEAARSVGASSWRIIFRHILPNSVGPIVVNATLSVAAAILTESTLSFLGFGVQPPTPTWGNLLAESKNQLLSSPWLVWFPGLFILVTVLCVNFLGDGLRDALDPTQQRVRA